MRQVAGSAGGRLAERLGVADCYTRALTPHHHGASCGSDNDGIAFRLNYGSTDILRLYH